VSFGKHIPWGVKRQVRRADNLTTFVCRLSWNLGGATSWNPQGLSRPVMGLLYLLRTVMKLVSHLGQLWLQSLFLNSPILRLTEWSSSINGTTANPGRNSCHFQCRSKPDLTARPVSVSVLCIKLQLQFTIIVGRVQWTRYIMCFGV